MLARNLEYVHVDFHVPEIKQNSYVHFHQKQVTTAKFLLQLR